MVMQPCSWRWCRALTFWSSRGTAESAFTATFTAGAAETTWAFATRTAHALPQTFCDLAHLRLIHEAVGIGIHLGEAVAIVSLGELVEFFLADLAVGIGVSALHEFSEAAAAFAFRSAVLGDSDAGAQRQGAEAGEEF